MVVAVCERDVCVSYLFQNYHNIVYSYYSYSLVWETWFLSVQWYLVVVLQTGMFILFYV